MKKYQEAWNKKIRAAGNNASRFFGKAMESIMREGGEFWIYQQSSYNTDAYRKGWERIFGSKMQKKGKLS